jgi:putative colanic acid biosynthesis acetyltransferase WcaF
MGDHACLSEEVDCYCVDKIRIGAHSTISQYSFLCTASHDYRRPSFPLVTAPITIGERAWVTADVFVGPGVTIGDGAVITARSSVFDDIPSWMVATGNPAVPVRPREYDGEPESNYHGHPQLRGHGGGLPFLRGPADLGES